ncbi:ubiquinone biosynthesis protein UbiJ [Natronocella acetinitrilica]|jgi:ubiquinone biosynthesis accessory factor UbiJ|uniref:Ubiquinone biosynthesis accessory factor UbiJ n=1 Tax=Natronocella acetinitrilica TaxID=414046 RepID=A0AAE3G198_9GAMM|nr:SCP2 sterol-binding domain-containing protein [Natronocella acetinitrilica]MCP1673343.1 ubiquinone biosynthesis protein UbiJ [Natronocella acetinitrilica]
MEWLNTLLKPLNRVLDHVISLDPDARSRLGQLAGRRLGIELEGTSLALSVSFTSDGVILAPWDAATEPADASIRGTPLALLNLARDPLGGGDQVSFNGDLGFVRDVRQLLAGLDIDLEEQLSRMVGDDIAHQAGATGRRLRHWLADVRVASESGLAEYLTEERRLLPSEAETALFLSAVDELREHADRLEARLRHLERRLAGDGTGA